MDKLISKEQAIDKIKKRLFETAYNNAGIKQNVDETLVDVAENRLENWFDELPFIQPERKMGHWICESQWSDTMGTNWNTWKCDQCNVVAAKGWEHTRDGSKPNGKFCSECGAPMDEKVIFINITEKE